MHAARDYIDDVDGNQMRDRRVVVVSHHLENTPDAQLEGVRSTLGVCHEIAACGVTVHVLVASPDSATAKKIEGLSSENCTVSALPLSITKPQSVSRFSNIREVLKKWSPDVVHVLGEPWQVGVITALRAAHKLGAIAGVSFTENGPALKSLGGSLRRLGGRIGLASADYAIGWSRRAEQLAQSAWRFSRPTAVMPSIGVPKPFFTVGDTSRSARERKALFVGRLVPEKGITDILHIAPDLVAHEVGLVIVGDGPMREEVIRASTAGLVEYRGAVPRPSLPDVFSRALVTLVPSHPAEVASDLGVSVGWEEQFGRVIAESQAAGTPVVAYDSGEIREVLGPGGRLVDLGDAGAMKDATLNLARSEEAWVAASTAARDWVRRFSEPALAHQLIRMWNSVTSP